MMNGDGKPFLTLAEAASKLPAELCATADSLRETPPTGLIVTHCGPNGDKAVHVDDLGDFLQKYVAGASIDPAFELLDAETTAALRAAQGRLNRAGRKALAEVAQLGDREAARDIGQRMLRGEISYPFPTGEPAMSIGELVEGIIEKERARLQRRHELRNPRDGRSDPWAVSHILTLDDWDLLKPGIHTGICWLWSKRGGGYRLRRGDRRVFQTLPDAYGFNPITQQLQAELLENCRDFRQALADQTLRQVERPK